MSKKYSSLRHIGVDIRNQSKSILSAIDNFTSLQISSAALKKDTEDTSDKNPVIATYRQHIIFMFRHWIIFLFFLFIITLGIYGICVSLNIPIPFTVIVCSLVFIPLLLGMLLRSIVYWIANATVIRKKNLVFHKYYGVFTQSVEVRSITQIKSFDLVQSGIMGYMLNYGDIEVASMISGAAKNIVLKNISPVKNAYKTLSDHIDSLDAESGKKGETEEIKI